MMHGARPKVKELISPEHIEISAKNADPSNRKFAEAVANAHNTAHEHVLECWEACEKQRLFTQS